MTFFSRLLLNPQNSPGVRASKVQVNFKLYRTFRKFLYWSPVTHDNMALFYGENENEKNLFVKNIVEQAYKNVGSVEIAFYDFNGNSKEIGVALNNVYENFFIYREYPESFEVLVNDLIKFRSIIRENNVGTGFLEPIDRKFVFMFVDVTNVDLLKENEKTINDFVDVVKNSFRDRLYVIPIARNAFNVPVKIHESLDWATYLGLDNAKYVKELHSSLEDGYYSVKQLIIGATFNANDKRLQIIHPLKYTPSEWQISKENRLNAEDEAYKKLLDSLDDGGIQ